MTEIKYCPTCAKNKIEHEFQDKMYGKFHRVFNTTKDDLSCTVCGSDKKKKK